jgi:hypothetical protein
MNRKRKIILLVIALYALGIAGFAWYIFRTVS